MRWSEFAVKECVDVGSGEKLGNFAAADMEFNPATGKIEGILLETAKSTWFKKNARYLALSWPMIKKIGPEMVIVDTLSEKR
ncbi:YlmC/YmxH family sporulation protein [Laceyella putida]|jgi:YlmC/YmxH family sporulation protein|uniref:YlmC/YmxH family sporulation protein n=1 Tax=Laceyella putida TaxID=110101 RepID=A0ABW2RNX2_9BACL